MHNKRIARWESRSGKHWVELHQGDLGFSYMSPAAGGCFKGVSTKQEILQMQYRIDSGYFQPDANITPMKRIQLDKKG